MTPPPVRADAPSCLVGDESANFRYGGAIANPDRTTSMWLTCDARPEELKITTKISTDRGKGEANHVIIAMQWVEPLPNVDSRK